MTMNTNNQQQITIAYLLSQRQWSVLESILTSSSESRRPSLPIDDMSLPHAITSEIILHFATRFQAPLRIVSLLARIYPMSLTSADATGRYPIHVASKWSATPDVIAFLIKANPSVVGVQDSLGKTPMHYVGECYLAHYNSPMYNRDDSMLQVVRLLKTAAPLSVNLEDNEEMNAIEYALLSEASLKVVKTMQRACRDDWRERSKASLLEDGPSTATDDSEEVATEVTPKPNTTEQKKPPQLVPRRRHKDLVNEMLEIQTRLQREFSNRSISGSDNMKSGSDRVHVHRSSGVANTRAARTA